MRINDMLICPLCKKALTNDLTCPTCRHRFPFENDIYIMLHPDLDGNEWKWDEKVFSRDVSLLIQENAGYLNKETMDARKEWFEIFSGSTNDFHGIVMDLATGLGGLFSELLKSDGDFIPIATDVDPNILFATKNRLERAGLNGFHKIASNARHIALKDDAVDFVTTLSGFGNIPNGFSAIEETYRTLKGGGKLVAMLTFVDKDSESAKFAKELGVERAIVKDFFVKDLERAGFRKIAVDTASSATWAENPLDALPVAGDTQHFTIVKAEK